MKDLGELVEITTGLNNDCFTKWVYPETTYHIYNNNIKESKENKDYSTLERLQIKMKYFKHVVDKHNEKRIT